jgi:hypothetical protein
MNRIRSAACAAFLCALVASLCVVAASAAAEPVEGPSLPSYDGDLSFGILYGPADPDEFSWQVKLQPGEALRQLSETVAEVEYTGTGHEAFDIVAIEAHDADGAKVPTSLRVSDPDIVTLTVHDREGNPAAGGAPFVYPVLAGAGWEGGFQSPVFIKGPPDEMEIEAERVAAERAREAQQAAAPGTVPPSAAPTCTVPSLHGFGLVAVKKLLRGADCAIGQVRLGQGATKGKGKVVTQFKPAGAQLDAGAPVAVKLASS